MGSHSYSSAALMF
ncbi:Protein CBG27044 [Caenorhabditis briggsae]|uniref:Protein CBG27044 n=1 Tax=Caenorhabditis briggsae TaxID=6238 RepID=B6IMA8_CAEBR|nr:Protein CBG27044 [Caenorhabditis briggsae]CAS01038.1 Protein CBG27044 [Caenorhabditis briggsae]